MSSPLVTLACHAPCEACSLQLTRGSRAWLVGTRTVRCETCGPAEVALTVPPAPPTVGPEVRAAARLMTTIGVALKSVARLAWDRLRGKRRTGPVVVRRAFEELGPTYTKLGQLVALTQGIFPEDYCAELRGCLDRVRPVSFESIERVVAAELGSPLSRIFSEIDTNPLASASIAQVHAARLKDGSDVVIKVQRPGIGDAIAADVRLLRGVARLVGMSPRGSLASPEAVVDDFAKTLFEELDFTREAENMAQFNAAMKDLDRADVAAPRVVQ